LGKIQTTLKLIAHLIYPEIELSTNDVNIIANPKQSCTSNFFIRNPSDKLTASFELKFKDNSTIITSLHEKRQENLLNIVECLMKQKLNLRETFFQQDFNDDIILYYSDDCDISNVSNDDVRVENKGRHSQKSNETNSAKTIQVTSKEISQYFNSVTKEIPKTELNEEPDEELPTTSKDEQNECFLLLSQMKGILKPNESRLIYIQFSGSNKGRRLFFRKISTCIACF
jgi:hypothetical protein